MRISCFPSLRGYQARVITLLSHEPSSKHALGFILVMCTAPQPNSCHRRGATPRYRFDVVEFEKLSGLASDSFRAHERALTLVALPDRAADCRGDVACSGRAPPPEPTARIRIRLAPSGSELLPLELGDEGIQRSIENLGDVSTRNGMAQQLLHIPQLVVGAPADRHLDEKPLRSGIWRHLDSSWDELIRVRPVPNSSWDEFHLG
jgi:hypothetical protein